MNKKFKEEATNKQHWFTGIMEARSFDEKGRILWDDLNTLSVSEIVGK